METVPLKLHPKERYKDSSPFEDAVNQLREIKDAEEFYLLGGENMEKLIEMEHYGRKSLKFRRDVESMIVELGHKVSEWQKIDSVKASITLKDSFDEVMKSLDQSLSWSFHKAQEKGSYTDYVALKNFQKEFEAADVDLDPDDHEFIKRMELSLYDFSVPWNVCVSDALDFAEAHKDDHPHLKECLMESRTAKKLMANKGYDQSSPAP